MRISKKGIQHIKDWEQLRLNAYQDVKGVWTIGYGHTGTARKGMSISEPIAEHLLSQDLAWAEDAVNEGVKVDINQNQFDALVSFVFNVGRRAFLDSTLLRKLNNRNFEDIPFEFSRWVYSGGKKYVGLANRRASEAELFTTPVDTIAQNPPDHDTAPPPKHTPAVNIEPAPVRQERQDYKSGRTVKGAGGAIAGTFTAGTSTVLSKADGMFENVPWFDDVAATMFVIGLLVALFGALYVIYARRDDWLKSTR